MIATKNAEIWHSLNYSLPFIFIKFYDISINILICNWLSCFSSKYWPKISSCTFSEFLYLHNCRWFWKVLAPCTDPCGPNWSDKAASTAADDDLYRVETCTDYVSLIGPMRQQVLQLTVCMTYASTGMSVFRWPAKDDILNYKLKDIIAVMNLPLKIINTVLELIKTNLLVYNRNNESFDTSHISIFI